jgi:hypothetical protein
MQRSEGVRQRQINTTNWSRDMPDLIAVVLASLPFILFAILLIETFRNTPTASDGLPVDIFHRSFGA